MSFNVIANYSVNIIFHFSTEAKLTGGYMRRTADPGVVGRQIAEGGGLQQRGQVVRRAGDWGQTLASIIAVVRTRGLVTTDT